MQIVTNGIHGTYKIIWVKKTKRLTKIEFLKMIVLSQNKPVSPANIRTWLL